MHSLVHAHPHAHTCTRGLAPLLAHTFTLEDLAEAWRGVGDMEGSLHSLQSRANDRQLLGEPRASQVGKYLAVSTVVTLYRSEGTRSKQKLWQEVEAFRGVAG